MDEISECKPIFIVGMNGSGTTMLLDCLNNHPVLYGFMRETKLIPYYIKNIKKFGDLANDNNFLSLFNEFRNLSFFRYTNNGTAPPLPDNWKTLPRNLASVVDSVFNYYAEREGKKYWCEKSPMNAQHISILSKLFPNGRFIHIIRDGRACAASFYRRFNNNPKLTMYRWKNIVREARRQGRDIGKRYMEIRYEDLTEFPKKNMRTICDFLDILYCDDLLNLSRKRSFTGSSERQIKLNTKSWEKILSGYQINELEMIGGELLAELKYDTKCPTCDMNPNRVILNFWLYRDFIKWGLKEVKRPKKEKWDDLYAIVTRAIKQRMISKY